MEDKLKQLKTWVRSQHLICVGTDFIFETVDQTQLDKFEVCIQSIGGRIRKIEAVGNWPMGPRRSFKILRATCSVPRPGGENIVTYWAKKGSRQTRYSDIIFLIYYAFYLITFVYYLIKYSLPRIKSVPPFT